MSVENDQPGERGGRDFIGEEVDDEDTRSDEANLAGGVQGEAVVRGEIGGDIDGILVRVVVVENLGFKGWKRGED